MTEDQKFFWIGLALIVVGVGMILFGGTKVTGGTRFTLFGFEFGSETREPMSRGESWFWGLALAIGGAVMVVHS